MLTKEIASLTKKLKSYESAIDQLTKSQKEKAKE
jgi:hypothetical protein